MIVKLYSEDELTELRSMAKRVTNPRAQWNSKGIISQSKQNPPKCGRRRGTLSTDYRGVECRDSRPLARSPNTDIPAPQSPC